MTPEEKAAANRAAARFAGWSSGEALSEGWMYPPASNQAAPVPDLWTSADFREQVEERVAPFNLPGYERRFDGYHVEISVIDGKWRGKVRTPMGGCVFQSEPRTTMIEAKADALAAAVEAAQKDWKGLRRGRDEP